LVSSFQSRTGTQEQTSRSGKVKGLGISLAPVVTPVILATKEAEIRTIVVQSQPRQIVHKTLSQNTHHKKGLVEWLKV
jgi:hypothetical protein